MKTESTFQQRKFMKIISKRVKRLPKIELHNDYKIEFNKLLDSMNYFEEVSSRKGNYELFEDVINSLRARVYELDYKTEVREF